VLQIGLHVPYVEHHHCEPIEQGGLRSNFFGLDVDEQLWFVLGEDLDDLHICLVRAMAEQAEELEETEPESLDLTEELTEAQLHKAAFIAEKMVRPSVLFTRLVLHRWR